MTRCVMHLLHGHAAAVQQVAAQVLKLGAGEVALNVLRAVRRRRDERQRDGRLRTPHGGVSRMIRILSCMHMPLWSRKSHGANISWIGRG